MAYLATFSMLMEHFQMAPVVAASSCLLSACFSKVTSDCRPLFCRTRSRVCLSSAHWTHTHTLQINPTLMLYTCLPFIWSPFHIRGAKTRPCAAVKALQCRSEPIGHRVRQLGEHYLEDGTGAVHLKLLVVAAEVLHQILDHSFALYGNSVTPLPKRMREHPSPCSSRVSANWYDFNCCFGCHYSFLRISNTIFSYVSINAALT